jgi:hypothetical protein
LRPGASPPPVEMAIRRIEKTLGSGRCGEMYRARSNDEAPGGA